MEIRNGQIVLGRKRCVCGDGTVATRELCPKCKGTGRGVRGAYRGCKRCSGSQYTYNQDKRITCSMCKGHPEDAQPETLYDSISGWAGQIPFKIIRQNRGASFNESYLGIGTIYSAVDYGQAWKRSDEEVLAGILDRGNESAQGIHIGRKSDLRVCDYIAVVVTKGGYSLRPVWEDAESGLGDDELSVDRGMAYGTVVYAAGGNGTMAAAMARKK